MELEAIYRQIINRLFKMLCWNDEGKNWGRLYDEFLQDISLDTRLDQDVRSYLVLRVVSLKYVNKKIFRDTIFEVINYVESLPNVSRESSF